jgi:WD40 repeat protein
LAVGHDGAYFASSSSDETVKIWVKNDLANIANLTGI